MSTIDLAKHERYVATVRMEVGVRIVPDYDHEPFGEQELIDEETERLASGEWAAYGVIVIVRPADSTDDRWTRTAVSVWGCVVDADDNNVGTWFDLARIPDAYLRYVARDEIAEYLASPSVPGGA